MSDFTELAKADLNSLTSGFTPPTPTDISGLNLGSSVSSDKIFSTISSDKVSSNVFGIYDTKQAVQELSGDITSTLSTDTISSLSSDKLKNLANKTGLSIDSDNAYQQAADEVFGKIGDLKQKAFSSDMFGSVVDVYTKSGAIVKATLLENVNLDTSISKFFGSNVSPGDFASLQKVFNSGGLGSFNSCDALATALDWAKKLLGAGDLFNSLKSLFGFLSKYDISGMLSCLSRAQQSLSMVQKVNLTDTLVGGGAINSMKDLTSLGSNGSIVNSYDTVRRLGSNSSYSSSNSGALSGLFSNLGVDKTSIYTSGSKNNTTNESFLNSIRDPVYDRSEILDNKNSEFVNYCFDNSGTNKLISSIPNSTFT